MSLRTCPKHGPYVADDSTDFGETWCPECGPEGGRRVSDREAAIKAQVENFVDDLRAAQEIVERDRTDTGERLTLKELAATLGLDDLLADGEGET